MELGASRSPATATPPAGLPCPSTPVVGELWCIKCGEQTTQQESFAAGGCAQFWKRKSKACKSIQNSLDNRSKKNPALKAAFRRKSPDDQQQWFREQKRARTAEGMKHTSHNFDSLEIAEVQQQSTGEEIRERIHWKPYAVWAEEKACLTMWFHVWL